MKTRHSKHTCALIIQSEVRTKP